MINPVKISIIEDQVLSDNWYTLRKITYDKTTSGHHTVRQVREVYDRGNGATILLYNKERQTVILTRQFRLPTYVNGNDTGMLIETCAGLLDKDHPEVAIKRETEEETGYKIDQVEKVFEAYMSPGSVTEILYFFVASYTKEMKVSEGGGLEDEDESIEVLEIPYVTALEMITSGRIRDGKTILLLQYAQLHKLL
jgi:nudix-type nucleoside diphosphatase (YffH/AdpP family)